MNEQEFAVDKTKPSNNFGGPGFVPNITASVGYGTKTKSDPETKQLGLVPLPTKMVVGISGRERQVDNPECYAKAVQFDDEDTWVYYIRMNASGDLSDPWGLYNDGNSAQNMRDAKHKGTSLWQFKRVKEETFMVYLKYLASRNVALLRICERQVKDNI